MVNAIIRNCFLNEAVQKILGKEGGEEREANHFCLFSPPLVTAECSLTTGLHVACEKLWYCFWTQLDNSTEDVKGEVSLRHFVLHISFFRLVKVEAPALRP